MNYIDTSQFWFLKTVLQIKSNSLVIKQNEKKTKKYIYICENWVSKLNCKTEFLCHITDIKIAWNDPCISPGP